MLGKCCCCQPESNHDSEMLLFTMVQVIRALSQTYFLSQGDAPGQQKREIESKWSYINIYLKQSFCGGRNVLVDLSQQRQNNPQTSFCFLHNQQIHGKERLKSQKTPHFSLIYNPNICDLTELAC